MTLTEALDSIKDLAGVTIELVGKWIWVTGDTRPVKEELKKAGFRFSPKKVAWYFHEGPYRKFNGTEYDLEDIRTLHGSKKLKSA